MSWKSTIAKEQRVKNAIRETSKEQSWVTLQKELLDMHAGRQSRTLFSSKAFLKATKISAAALQDSAFRSRAVEILITARVHTNLLNRYIDRLTDYLKSTYATELKEFPTINQRDSAVRSALEPMYEQSVAADNVIEVAELIIADIDQASWGMSKALSALDVLVNKGKEL